MCVRCSRKLSGARALARAFSARGSGTDAHVRYRLTSSWNEPGSCCQGTRVRTNLLGGTATVGSPASLWTRTRAFHAIATVRCRPPKSLTRVVASSSVMKRSIALLSTASGLIRRRLAHRPKRERRMRMRWSAGARSRPQANDPTLRYGVLDPACFKEDGGPSIAERINKELIAARLRPFHAADNSRVPHRGSMGGWDQLRSRLVGQDGRPMIYCFSAHSASIRTIPALQHDFGAA